MTPPKPPLFLLPALALAACGYAFDRDRGQARLASGNLPKVAVIPFDNTTYRRGLEMTLTRLLDDEVRARSPRSPVAPAEADWLIRGSIVRADERIYSENREDVVTESSIMIHVDVTLEDRAAEKILRTYPFKERVAYSAFAGRIATLQQAEAEALREIAQRIVDWLEAGHPERRP